MNRFMMATKAEHVLGDLSEDKPTLCVVYEEVGDYYIGSWIEGFGFYKVKFPKATTRELTEDEIKHWNGKGIFVGNRLTEVIQTASAS
jgi:ribosomal protein S16